MSTLSVWKSGLEKEFFFGVKEIFFLNFDLRNSCKNELEDNSEKSSR